MRQENQEAFAGQRIAASSYLLEDTFGIVCELDEGPKIAIRIRAWRVI